MAPQDVLRVVLARSARSARRTTHFDLDFPRAPQLEPYWCYKHRRECRPVESARRFLLRYTLDTLARIEAFAALRADGCVARMVHGDARTIDLGGPYDGVITSPPYPGLIDYHGQHSYAYELLGLDERRDLGARAAVSRHESRRDRGVRRRRRRSAREHTPLTRARWARLHRRQRPPRSVPEILSRSGLKLVDRHERHVNRRTGRRAGEYYESVLVAAAR